MNVSEQTPNPRSRFNQGRTRVESEAEEQLEHNAEKFRKRAAFWAMLCLIALLFGGIYFAVFAVFISGQKVGGFLYYGSCGAIALVSLVLARRANAKRTAILYDMRPEEKPVVRVVSPD